MNTTKLEFHVPHFRFTNGILEPAKYEGFRSELINFMEKQGVTKFNNYMEKEFVEHYEFDEEVLVVQCSSDDKSALIKGYTDLLLKYHKEFQHIFYICGVNGFNHTICVDSNSVKILQEQMFAFSEDM